MDKLVIALMIPGSIILCLVAGKRLWIRALAIVVLLLALGIVLPNMQYDRSRVALALQSLFLTEFTKDVGRLIDSGQHQTASLRLAEFNRRFLQDAQEPEKLSGLATADGHLQLTVYSKLANENVSIEDKQKMLESCVRSGLTCIEVTKDLLPYSIFRSQRIYTEVGIIKTNFYAIKARIQ